MFDGDAHWRKVKVPSGETYKWDIGSTYVQNPPYFEGLKMEPEPVKDIENARILALFGDKITTDHISPAGSIKEASPAGQYLLERQVSQADFNQYGTRRGNHEIMMRGTFANIRIKNFILQNADGTVPEGGYTKHWPDGEEMLDLRRGDEISSEKACRSSSSPAPNTAMARRATGRRRARGCSACAPSSPNPSSASIARTSSAWASCRSPSSPARPGRASASRATSRSRSTASAQTLKPRQTMEAEIKYADGKVKKVPLLCRIATLDELEYFNNGGILALRACASSPRREQSCHDRQCDSTPLAVRGRAAAVPTAPLSALCSNRSGNPDK